MLVVKTLLTVLATAIVVLSIQEAGARRSFDEVKAERLAKQREARRSVEVKYQACMLACRVGCAP